MSACVECRKETNSKTGCCSHACEIAWRMREAENEKNAKGKSREAG